jgi:hypothetical protein
MNSARTGCRVPLSHRRHRKHHSPAWFHVQPTPPPTLPSLPYDLLAQIFAEHQPQYSNGTWDKPLNSYASFATVNSDVHSLVTAGLYRHLVFEGMGLFGDDHVRKGEKCCRTLQRNPALALRVQSCSIVYLMPDTDEDPDVQLLADTLRLMTNIRSLELKDFSLSLPLLQAICSLESLESLSFKSCDFPSASSPKPCFALSKLTALDSGPIPISSLIKVPEKLHSLVMDAECTTEAIPTLPWTSLASLTHLYAEPSHTAASQFNTLLSSLSSLRDVGFCHPCTSAPYTVSDFDLPSASLPLLERYMGPSALAQTFVPGRSVHTVVLDQKQDSGGIRPRNLRSASLPFPIRESLASLPAAAVKELDVVVGKLDMSKWRAMGRFSKLGKLKVTCLDSTPSLVRTSSPFSFDVCLTWITGDNELTQASLTHAAFP